uniref:Kinase suppressor of Ras 2 n=1 Tax=Cacopsylla melanoneura TaxID=428564 RepID=A0A8D8M8Z4_9HEMI
MCMISDAQIADLKRALDVNQSMIDISADRLERLRTQCVTSAELTQHEIRTIEGKLIKLFSRQLVTKAKLGPHFDPQSDCSPSLRQWLQVVGLRPESVGKLCTRLSTLENLQERSEADVRHILTSPPSATGNGSPYQLSNSEEDVHRTCHTISAVERRDCDEELRRLTHALHNLKHYTDILLRDSADSEFSHPPTHHTSAAVDSNGPTDTYPLYWDSWDRSSRQLRVSSVPGPNELRDHSDRGGGGGEGDGFSSNSHSTPGEMYSSSAGWNYSASTPSTPPVFCKNERNVIKFPTTPTPRKKHDTGLVTPTLLPDATPLTKSKSHESQLANKIDNGVIQDCIQARRGRLPTEPTLVGHISPLLSSPIKSPPLSCVSSDYEDTSSHKSVGSNLQVPKSPRTPKTMVHVISHRFTKTFKMKATCDYCDKQMLIETGLKCKDCKYKCHKECSPKVPPSCGLTQEIVDVYKEMLSNGHPCFAPSQSPNLGRPSPNHVMSRRSSKATLPDSSSTSSCNSSAAASPSTLSLHYKQHDVQQFHFPPDQHAAYPVQQQFHFPDVVTSASESAHTTNSHSLSSSLIHSQDSDKTMIGSGSSGGGGGTLQGGAVTSASDSDRSLVSTPVRVNSVDSAVSDGEGGGGGEGGNAGSGAKGDWPRQNSLSMKEWDIPWPELNMGDRIGKGHFGTVYNGNWHGEVAVKVLDVDYLDDEKTWEAFKFEVTTFRKTRHENLVLFMGACMKPPHLAIVTSKCNGHTLYTNIHIYKEKFALNKMSTVGQQISQGMGYLHARGILHKDLKSKNIFIEKNNKVVITDFGLFNFSKLYNRVGNGLSIPRGWLCYLAPEIMRSLRAHQKYEDEELPISKESDVYAFGTVWFELLCGEWPFKDQSPESIIFQVGKGMKPSLANLQASQDVKDVLMKCWSYKPSDRPDFITLMKSLEKLPKKRILARSPSHPLNLSRSAESVF